MKLETDQGIKKDNPTFDEISNAINELMINDGSFVGLSNSKSEFIQATFSGEDGIMIEYRESKTMPLYRSVRKNLSTNEVDEIFKAYYSGDTNWMSGLRWEATNLDEAPPWTKLTSKIGFSVVVIIVIIGYFTRDQLLNHNPKVDLFTILFLLFSYALVAATIQEYFTSKTFLGRRIFWNSIMFAIIATFMLIISLFK